MLIKLNWTWGTKKKSTRIINMGNSRNWRWLIFHILSYRQNLSPLNFSTINKYYSNIKKQKKKFCIFIAGKIIYIWNKRPSIHWVPIMCTRCDKHWEDKCCTYHSLNKHLLLPIMPGTRNTGSMPSRSIQTVGTHSYTELSKHDQCMTETGTERAEEGHATQLRGWGLPPGGGNAWAES